MSTRPTQPPPREGCKDPQASKRFWSGARLHDWEYSSSWNGNNPKVLPFSNYPHGIARSGYRCYNCGKFAWDDHDADFALSHARAMGLVRLPTCAEATTKPTPNCQRLECPHDAEDGYRCSQCHRWEGEAKAPTATLDELSKFAYGYSGLSLGALLHQILRFYEVRKRPEVGS